MFFNLVLQLKKINEKEGLKVADEMLKKG